MTRNLLKVFSNDIIVQRYGNNNIGAKSPTDRNGDGIHQSAIYEPSAVVLDCRKEAGHGYGRKDGIQN